MFGTAAEGKEVDTLGPPWPKAAPSTQAQTSPNRGQKLSPGSVLLEFGAGCRVTGRGGHWVPEGSRLRWRAMEGVSAQRASDPPRDEMSPGEIETGRLWQFSCLESRFQGTNVPN